MVAAFNADCMSVVPAKGTVGASGDLAPLSHLALGLMGEGPMWDPDTGAIGEAAEILARKGLSPITLQAKEGLAMINGTQVGALGAADVRHIYHSQSFATFHFSMLTLYPSNPPVYQSHA